MTAPHAVLKSSIIKQTNRLIENLYIFLKNMSVHHHVNESKGYPKSDRSASGIKL